MGKSSKRRILHKLLKHVIPGIHLKLFKTNNETIEDDFINNLSNKYIESPWCSPSLNYWNIVNQFIICSLLNDGKNKSSNRTKESISLGKKDSWNQVNWEVFSNKIKDKAPIIPTSKRSSIKKLCGWLGIKGIVPV